METEYSSDIIAGARSLQTFTYIYTSMATFWTYDYSCSIHDEWTFLLQSRWTKVKGLYIVTRYTPFLLFASHLFLNFSPNEDPEKCQILNNICSCFSLISVICSECIPHFIFASTNADLMHEGFFIIRTYALWNNNKIVLSALLLAFISVIIASVGVLFSATANAPFVTSLVPGVTGCYQSSGSAELYIPFLLLFSLELGIICLTLVRAIQSWRATNNTLYVVLLKHNIFYYACGLFFSMVNVLTSLFLRYAYNAMFQDFQLVVLAILATRMHLYLWHADRDMRSSDALMFIAMSDISSSDRPM